MSKSKLLKIYVSNFGRESAISAAVMVTAAAPALPDSQALPHAATGTASSSSRPSTSFQSVYQSLPLLPGDSVNQLESSKLPASKKNSLKNTDDTLPAPVNIMAAASPSQRPWTAQLSFSMNANASNTEPEATAREVAQLSLSEQETATLDRLASLKQSAVADANSVSSSITAAADATIASTRQAAASREPAFHLQAPATPSYLLGVPSLAQVSPVESSSESRQSANSSRSAQTSAPQQPSVDPALFTKGLAAALAPQNGNLAFSLKMMESTLQARHAQQVAQPASADQNQAGTQAKSEEHSPLALLAPNAAHATPSAAVPGDVVASAASVSPVWNEAAAAPQWNVTPDTQLSEPQQPPNLSTVAALQDAQPILPETPRPSATSEILLQLGGKDQAAAIRVTDRGGAVNVSVHATDPDLRSSLRSNLGDLATQLTHQGWKTEVVKTGTTLTRGETPQDPQQDGQRSPGQQQPSSQGERQSQRDRRGSSGQWLAEFEQQASGNSGGTNS